MSQITILYDMTPLGVIENTTSKNFAEKNLNFIKDFNIFYGQLLIFFKKFTQVGSSFEMANDQNYIKILFL